MVADVVFAPLVPAPLRSPPGSSGWTAVMRKLVRSPTPVLDCSSSSGKANELMMPRQTSFAADSGPAAAADALPPMQRQENAVLATAPIVSTVRASGTPDLAGI